MPFPKFIINLKTVTKIRLLECADKHLALNSEKSLFKTAQPINVSINKL